jgi:antirestriction protein ArdC
MPRKKTAKPKGMTISDLQVQVAGQVIDMIETEGLKWFQRWATPRPPINGVSGHVYSGINVLTTAIWMMANQTDDPRFLPRSVVFPKDPEARVGRLRKGEKSIPIVAAGSSTKIDEKTGEKIHRQFYRIHRVWHVSQLDDLDEKKLVPAHLDDMPENPAERDAEIERFVDRTGAVIKPAKAAFYDPAGDQVGMPPIETFRDNGTTSAAEYYYGTLLHEMVHWTGAESRLDRSSLRQYAKKEERAREELVAEIGAVMAGMRLGLQAQPREDNASYIQGWVKLLEDKPAAIFEAASAAGRAVNYLAKPKSDAVSHPVSDAREVAAEMA